MPAKKGKLPGVLLIVLSALGILIGLLVAIVSIAGIYWFSPGIPAQSEIISRVSTGLLALTIGILNFPTLISGVRKLSGKPLPEPSKPLFKKSSIFMIFWILILITGYFISRGDSGTLLLAPMTIVGVIIPIWWLIELARTKLPHSTSLREWGTLSIGLTVAPSIIMLVEILLIIAGIIMATVVLGLQTEWSSQLPTLPGQARISGGETDGLEELLFDLMKNPVLSTAIFLTAGLFAPLTEEIIKPMATWFLFNRPLKEYEGYSLGLISGGAFALLESAGMIIQINVQEWLPAVALRAITGVLHIGLSGFVSYGLTRHFNTKQYGRGILYIFIATLLHGSWNTLALFSGFSTILLPETVTPGTSDIASVISVILMVLVFISVIVINVVINSKLRRNLLEPAHLST